MRLGAPLGVAACTALAYFFPDVMVSPGDLRKGHEQITQACLPCHTPFSGASREKCIACHPIEQIGAPVAKENPSDEKPGKEKILFHAHLGDQDCFSCHGEHGYERNDAKFAHASLKPDVQRKCALCHQIPKDKPHLRVVDTCNACHMDKAWSPAVCDHQQHFVFSRKHPPKCEKCHPDGNHKRYTCYGCHEHTPSKTQRVHSRARVSDPDNCSDCHRNGSKSEARRIWKAIQDKAREKSAP